MPTTNAAATHASTDQYASSNHVSNVSRTNQWHQQQSSNNNNTQCVNYATLAGYSSNSDVSNAPACGYFGTQQQTANDKPAAAVATARGYNVTDEDKLYLYTDTARFYQCSPSNNRLSFRGGGGFDKASWHHPVGEAATPVHAPYMDASTYRYDHSKVR